MDKDVEILQDWIARDRETRNNSKQSDYDKFCEEKCEAIEHIIIENINLYEKNNKLELALIDTDREMRDYKDALKLAVKQISALSNGCEEFNACQLCSNFYIGAEDCAKVDCLDGFCEYFKQQAKKLSNTNNQEEFK